MGGGITISRGICRGEEGAAARLFWQAFSGKLGRILGPDAQALAYLHKAIQPGRALCARDGEGTLVGLAGLKTRAGGFIAGDLSGMAAVYGWPGALWRGPLLETTDRPLAEGQMSLDGLCVAENRRDQGIGVALIRGVIAEAKTMGLHQVWLDVAETNPRARALYLREGFRVAGETRLRLLAPLFGFGRLEAMVREI